MALMRGLTEEFVPKLYRYHGLESTLFLRLRSEKEAPHGAAIAAQPPRIVGVRLAVPSSSPERG